MLARLLSNKRVVALLVLAVLFGVDMLIQKFSGKTIPDDRRTPASVEKRDNPPEATDDEEDEGKLAREERQGGHLIRQHVGQTPEQLRARLDRERRINAASSFTDLASAEQAVAAALRTNRDHISRWLADSSPRFVLNYTAAQNIGITLRRDDREPVQTRRLRLVLVRDPRESDGYRILTGYPTP